uniref:ORF6 n=1 Tax=Manihot esculenta associated ampelovirus 2 TaxID=2843332 RepID=A0A8F0FQL0_9CLOS|nr:ORF6 [Manihot esculenta associated ampelovirus 2]
MECVLKLRRALSSDFDAAGNSLEISNGWCRWRDSVLYYRLEFGDKLAFVFDKLYQSKSALQEMSKDLLEIMCSAGNVWMTNTATFMSIVSQETVLARYRHTIGAKLLSRAISKSEYCTKSPPILYDLMQKVVATDLPECEILAVGYERPAYASDDFTFIHSCAVVRIDGKLHWFNDGALPSDFESAKILINDLSLANISAVDKMDRLLSLLI